MPTMILDEPISRPDEDLLGRAQYANGVASLLLGAPADTSFRIGVYGDWGEGKTSVLRLMEQHLRVARFATGWLYPWAATSPTELRAQLIGAVADALSISQSKTNLVQSTKDLITRARSAADADWKVKLADSVFGTALQAGVDSIDKRQRLALLTRIRTGLQKRRTVIFVDDLDRTKADLVPELLMVLRDALDFPNLFYVIAVSPRILQDGLEAGHPGWREPHKFLEKIVEYPLYLPSLEEKQIRAFIDKHVSMLENSADREALAKLEPVFPRNPRQIKRFLRYIISMNRQVQRYAPNELDLSKLYLCQMLKVEFPEEASRLFEDNESVQELEYGTFLDAGRAGEENVPTARASDRFAPEAKGPRERFLLICDALRRGGLTTGRHSLRDLFYLVERPQTVTRKELTDFFARFVETAPEHHHGVIDEWVNGFGPDFSTAAASLFGEMVDLRDAILDGAADADTESATLERLGHASSATRLLEALLEDFGVLHSGSQDIFLWDRLYSHASKWAGWTRPKYYLKFRDEELDLLRLGTRLLPQHLHGEAYISLERREHSHVNPPSDAFLQIVEEVLTFFIVSVSSSALERFVERGGVNTFWGNGSNAAEKQVAFDPAATFHMATYRDQLRAIAARAPHDEVVHQNFLTYLRMLAYGALGGATTFSRSSCRTLFADSDFTRLIWNAAVAQPLNLRTAGSLLKERTQIISELRVPEDILQLPKWLQRMQNEYFLGSQS
jgi:hypothetical protein